MEFSISCKGIPLPSLVQFAVSSRDIAQCCQWCRRLGGNFNSVRLQVTYDIIRRRLQMENPHKQWLAVDLTRHLLSACNERLRPYRTELLYHVARVAIKPNKKGPITAQHKARKAATDYLHQCGEEGQNALRMARMQLGNFQQSGGLPVVPMGPYGPDGHPMNPSGAYSTVPQPCMSLLTAICIWRMCFGTSLHQAQPLLDIMKPHMRWRPDLRLHSSSDAPIGRAGWWRLQQGDICVQHHSGMVPALA